MLREFQMTLFDRRLEGKDVEKVRCKAGRMEVRREWEE